MVTQIEVDKELHTLTPPRLTLDWTIPIISDAMLYQVAWKDFIRTAWEDFRLKYAKEKRLKFPAIREHFGIFGITKKPPLYLNEQLTNNAGI